MSAKLPEGFKCGTCGAAHSYPDYVYAHWNELLTHTCTNCGAKHSIVGGKATLKVKGKIAKRKTA